MSFPRLTLLRNLSLLFLASTALTGCLVLDSSGPTPPVIVTINKLKLQVRSGTHAVAGASIQLYEADLTSYTGTSAARLPTILRTGADGNYTASTILVCNPSSLFYLVATGGDAGHGDDPSIALMTAIGSCDDLATTAITLNEATTVASAYALSGFTSSATSVSAKTSVGSGTKVALNGITNAFAMVRNLVDIHTGAVLTATPSGNGTVPTAKIDFLANLLAACNQSTGSSSAACTGLFAAAPSLAGVLPTDTLQAALNIAHNPGANLAALYALTTTGAYAPSLTALPNDLALSIIYTGTGTGTYRAMAADQSGHIWVTASSTTDTGTVVEFNPLGTVAATYTGAATGIANPLGIAIDPGSNVWVQSCGPVCTYPSATPGLTRIGNGGSPIQIIPQTAGNPYAVHAIASDGVGNIYTGSQALLQKYGNDGTLMGGNFPLQSQYGGPLSLSLDGTGDLGVLLAFSELQTYTQAGVLQRSLQLYSQFSGAQLTYNGTAYDHAGNLFVVGSSSYQPAGKSFTRFFKVAPADTSVFPGDISNNPGGINFPNAVVVDGAGAQWIANSGLTDLTAFTSAGTPFSPNSPPPAPPFFYPSTQGGFSAGFSSGSLTVAVDISGNAWIADRAGTRVAEYVGVATPVTPLSIGVRDNTVGQRP